MCMWKIHGIYAQIINMFVPVYQRVNGDYAERWSQNIK